jgi:hypothetical protein
MKRISLWIFVFLLILVVAGAVLAQVSTGFDLGWHVLSGGGGSRSSAGYQIDDTLGQWADGPSSSSHYQLASGFWHKGGGLEMTQRLYAPVVISTQP